MEVEVTGNPTPIVSWYKDNKPLKETLTSKYQIKTDGNIHRLLIENGDFIKLDSKYLEHTFLMPLLFSMQLKSKILENIW